VAGNINQAATGVNDATGRIGQTAAVSQSIAKDISAVSTTVADLRNGGEQVRTSAQDLSQLSEKLRELVGRFQV
jgi:methyl-accepting chemotaxis protein